MTAVEFEPYVFLSMLGNFEDVSVDREPVIPLDIYCDVVEDVVAIPRAVVCVDEYVPLAGLDFVGGNRGSSDCSVLVSVDLEWLVDVDE